MASSAWVFGRDLGVLELGYDLPIRAVLAHEIVTVPPETGAGREGGARTWRRWRGTRSSTGRVVGFGMASGRLSRGAVAARSPRPSRSNALLAVIGRGPSALEARTTPFALLATNSRTAGSGVSSSASSGANASRSAGTSRRGRPRSARAARGRTPVLVRPRGLEALFAAGAGSVGEDLSIHHGAVRVLDAARSGTNSRRTSFTSRRRRSRGPSGSRPLRVGVVPVVGRDDGEELHLAHGLGDADELEAAARRSAHGSGAGRARPPPARRSPGPASRRGSDHAGDGDPELQHQGRPSTPDPPPAPRSPRPGAGLAGTVVVTANEFGTSSK